MAGLLDGLGKLRETRRARREVDDLEKQVARLELQNERLRAAMRRCLTCDYRLDAISAQDDAAQDDAAAAASSIPGISDQ